MVVETLKKISPQVEEFIHQHQSSRLDWYPSDIFPAGQYHKDDEQLDKLHGHVKLSLVLNIITEEGLPHFHRLLHEAFGKGSPWRAWNFLWTAEEDRHGNLLRDYIRDSQIINMQKLERLQFQYILKGFEPFWGGCPISTIVYTVIQERATQFSHRNLSRLVKGDAPVMGKMLSYLSGDEYKHFLFYRNVLLLLLDYLPHETLEAMLKVSSRFQMPGYSIPDFMSFGNLSESLDIFNTEVLRDIVVDMIEFTHIEARDIPVETEPLRQKLLALPDKLTAFGAARAKRRTESAVEKSGEKVADYL